MPLANYDLFISYRRSDAAGYARALYRNLCRRFEKDRIFFDRESIEAGAIDIREVIDRLVAELQPMLSQKGQSIRVNAPEIPAIVAADARGFARLISALLDNAVKYTPTGGNIRLEIRESGDAYELEVTDSGAGIPDEEIPHIFDRFYRVDPSRNRQAGGHGLGLAIAQQIVLVHHGSIEAIPSSGGGACFRIRLVRHPDGDLQP
jgi:signal transduction histidine kinase